MKSNELSVLPTAKQYVQDVGGGKELITISKNLPEKMRRIAKTLNEDFPDIHDQMRGLENYKQQHEKQGVIDSFLTKGDMEKNRNLMIDLTMKSAMKQMEVVAFLAWINNEMLKMQDALEKAQERIAAQTASIEQQQQTIKEQQRQLLEQQGKIAENSGRMAAAIESVSNIRDVVMKMDDYIDRKVRRHVNG